MGALAHYIEREGIATTHVSLVKEHTLKIKPPRALWAPFELGRPFGAPDEADFQRRVLKDALLLLERPSGPVLEDFPDETPGPAADQEGWACPVSLGPALEDASVESDPLAALRQEIDRLRPWYELTVEKRGRTTVGISEVEIDDLAEYLVAFIGDADDGTAADRYSASPYSQAGGRRSQGLLFRSRDGPAGRRHGQNIG